MYTTTQLFERIVQKCHDLHWYGPELLQDRPGLKNSQQLCIQFQFPRVVSVQPLLVLDDSRYEYAMFKDLQQRYHWVLPTYRYQDVPGLLASLKEKIIEPAKQKAKELEEWKRGT